MSSSGRSHLSKAELKKRAESEIHVDSDNIQPPAFLKGKLELNKFRSIASELLKVGLITNIDCNAIGRLVVAYTKYDEIVEQLHNLDKEDLKYFDNLKKLSTLQQNYDKQILTLEREFGMTANSRSKMVVAKDSNSKEDLLLKTLSGDDV